jgi:uncharacterized membrane protein
MTQSYVGSTPRLEPNLSTDVGNAATADAPPERPEVNVNDKDRALSVAAGASLALLGLKVRGLTGLGMIGAGYMLAKRGYTGHCQVNAMLGRNTAEPAEPSKYFDRGIHVDVAFTVAKPREELFTFWRNFENLPKFMKHVESVTVKDDGKSRWVVRAPAGRTVEWDAEIINEEPGRLIAWRSLGGADVDNAGSVRFEDAPGDRGTEVRVVLDYIPPGGTVGKWVAMLFGEAPELTIKEDLRRFKRLMEAGEIPTIEGQSHGSCAHRN